MNWSPRIHLRWWVERGCQEFKDEIDIDHFEGRSWRGFHHHAALYIAHRSPEGKTAKAARFTTTIPTRLYVLDQNHQHIIVRAFMAQAGMGNWSPCLYSQWH